MSMYPARYQCFSDLLEFLIGTEHFETFIAYNMAELILMLCPPSDLGSRLEIWLILSWTKCLYQKIA